MPVSTVGTPSTSVTMGVVVPAAVAAAWRPMAEPPKIANQSSETALGTSSTPQTNCRMVRPRLIRAMNMPTKGVQLIHHAQ